jgi:hypothetical protein
LQRHTTHQGSQSPSRGAGVWVGLLVFFSRLPLIFTGPGDDADSWRVYIAAENLVRTGTYIPSRTPGYPLPEYIDAFLLSVGLREPFWLNLPIAIASAVAAAMVARLLAPLGPARAVVAALAFAFTPAVYEASIGPMDYMCGAALFLAALAMSVEQRTFAAAVLLGLAAASRATYSLGFIPVALILVQRAPASRSLRKTIGNLAVVAILSGAVAVPFYAPLFVTFESAWLTFADPGLDFVQLFGNATVQLFGVLGSLAVCCALVAAALRVTRPALAAPTTLRILPALALTSLIYFALFLRLPQESAYLVPALPGLYAGLVSVLPVRFSAALVVALGLSCAVGGVFRDYDGTLRLSWRGPVVRRFDTENRWKCVARHAKSAIAAEPPETLLVAGRLKPAVLVEWGLPPSPRVVYRVLPAEPAGWRDEEGAALPRQATFLVIDAVQAAQDEAVPVTQLPARVLRTAHLCGE